MTGIKTDFRFISGRQPAQALPQPRAVQIYFDQMRARIICLRKLKLEGDRNFTCFGGGKFKPTTPGYGSLKTSTSLRWSISKRSLTFNRATSYSRMAEMNSN